MNALHLTLKIMLKWGFFHALLVCKAKSLKRKVFFNAWRREVCSNTANSTRWKGNSNLTSQNPPAPPCQLPVSYVTVLLMFWALIRVMVLLFVLVPSCLQYPVVQADRIKIMQTSGSVSPSCSTASLFLATIQSISEQQMHSSTRWRRWQFPQVHLRYRYN